jgi:hypothetical protein
METTRETMMAHALPGMEVCDRDGHKIGSVAHVYEGELVAGKPGPGSYIEAKTGFLGLGKHLFIPYDAVRDITEGGVILSVTRDEARRRGWDAKPAIAQQQQQEAATSAAMSSGGDWNSARRYYMARWERRYKLPPSDWSRYERRYQFIWEMAQHPSYGSRSWSDVEPDLRGTWEVRYQNEEWNSISESMHDAWEHRDEAMGKSGS